ncbi:Helicase associated domain protein [Streptomyces xinghaiensis]|uniref:DEAD/DEAH box helicase n=1 Tax=Streptomyces TaxID=1883 RepID=UPI000A598E5F|nr:MULTISPECIES: DEAD/DEAH box helicase [Streptomyces]
MELRAYQKDIVQAVHRGLAAGGIGQVHMACGSGKTIVGQRSAEALLPHGGTVTVLVPSLVLAAQTLTAWRESARQPFDVLAVCSDDTVADAAVHTEDLPAPVTTSTEEITSWLRRPHTHGLRLVVCTYLSAPRLAEAVKVTGHLDLLILDEAHHFAGRADATTRKLLHPDALPARRRLFMTATPREDQRITRDSDSAPLIGMDDTQVFGPVLARYTFAQGITEGYLNDYRIAIIGVRDSEARKVLADERVEYVDALGAPSLQAVAAQVALARAREQFGVRRVLTFHPRVKDAAEFSRTLPGTLARTAPGTQTGLYAGHVHGQMSHQIRDRVLGHLRDTGEGWTVISNARCLGEGVDLPTVDGVLFAHPKRSAVDITQAVGRALRKDPQVHDLSTIIVPLVVPEEDQEVGDLDPGSYETLWHVVRSLRAHDEELGIALDNRRHYQSSGQTQLPNKITVVLPPGTSDAFLSQVKLLLVRQSTSQWWEGYHEAARYYQEHQHLLVPAEYRTDSGFLLGSWIAQRRYNYRRGILSAERVEKLEEIGMVWDPGAQAFAAQLQEAERFYAEHGHLKVPQSYVTSSGKRLGAWISNQRGLRKRGQLAPERIAALDRIGMLWELDAAWTVGITAARRYYAEHGHLRVPKSYVTSEGHSLGTWLNTQRIKYRKGELPEDRIAALGELGIAWEPSEERWQLVYAAARAYYAEHGHLRVPHAYTTPDGIKLGGWVLHQRQLRSGIKSGGIAPEHVAALDELGMRW